MTDKFKGKSLWRKANNNIIISADEVRATYSPSQKAFMKANEKLAEYNLKQLEKYSKAIL